MKYGQTPPSFIIVAEYWLWYIHRNLEELLNLFKNQFERGSSGVENTESRYNEICNTSNNLEG